MNAHQLLQQADKQLSVIADPDLEAAASAIVASNRAIAAAVARIQGTY